MEPKSQNQPVCVIGLGFVGLTMGLVLSEAGFDVTGIDNNELVIKSIKDKKPHFYEKGLDELLESKLGNGFDCFDKISADRNFDIYIIAVGTPLKEDNQPDFSQLQSAMDEVGKVLKRGDLIILRSTVPIGVTRNFVVSALENTTGLSADNKDFFIAFAPERTVEGEAISELKTLPQVIGGYNKESTDLAVALFDTFAPNIVIVDTLEEAEMVKVINNSYRDLTFAFANELALICDKFNIDTGKVIEASNSGYKRGGVPQPSPGVGGYCLTKDPYLLSYSAKQHGGYIPLLTDISRKVNSAMPGYVHTKIMDFVSQYYPNEDNVNIAVLGVAFKGTPPTSDARFSPTIDLIKLLQQDNQLKLFGHDFLVDKNIFDQHGVIYQADLEEIFQDKVGVIIMNNHPGYANLEIINLVSKMKKPALIFDPWKLYDVDLFKNLPGVFYANLGYTNFK